MYICVDGFDHTLDIPVESISLALALGDANNKLDFKVRDPGRTFALNTMQEVIVWDETMVSNSAGALAIPAHNIVLNPSFQNGAAGYTTTGTLAGLIALVAFAATMTFANSTNAASGFAQQVSPYGYIHPGQSYMFSVYITCAAPVAIQSVIKLEFLDASSTLIGSAIQDVRIPGAQTRVAISGTAPALAIYARISFGGQTTNATNSGVITFARLQLEPMYFTALGVSYPTPDCNVVFNSVNSASTIQMPDATTSRYNRIFSGYVEDIQASYDGPGRTWSVACAYTDSNLDSSGNNGANSQINASFTNSYDSIILNTLITTYFSGLLSISAGNGSTLIQGLLFTQVTYNDMSLKDILNAIIDCSGYTYFVDAFYRVFYQPYYYTLVNFKLTDATPDNITTFNLYEYGWEKDATQRKRQVKVVGSKFVAPAITDTFTGNGVLKTFGPLLHLPLDIKNVLVNAVSQLAGVAGVNTFAQGYAVLVDKNNKQMTFNVAPGNALSVSINYTYEAPVCVTVLGQDTDAPALAPAMVAPTYVVKVNDTSISDLATALDRGLTEITKYSKPRVILTFKSAKFVAPGNVVYITASFDGIVNQPFVVTAVDGRVLGNGIAEYSYTVGAYNPTVLDSLRQHHRAIAASTTSAGVTTPQQIDLVFSETVVYNETVTFTALAGNPGVYDTGTYGSTTFS